MNCKICNAELKEGAPFCQECGAKVGDDLTESSLKCPNCGAELAPGIKYCNQCGAAAADGQTENTEDNSAEAKDGAENNDNTEQNNVYSQQTNDVVTKAKSKIKKNPKFFGAIGVVALILVVASSISLGISGKKNKPAEASKSSSVSSKSGSVSSKSGSSSSKSGGSSAKSSGSSSTGKLTEKLKETMVASALMSEVKKKFPIADAGSTKYKINKSEQKNGYTVVYGKLYLYDKYGKASTGRSDGSGSYIRTFEVKISNSTNKVSSCTIK